MASKKTPTAGKSADEAKIARALRKLNASLCKKRHFIGYAVGRKTRGGRRLPGLAAILFVSKKVPDRLLKPKDRLPTHVQVGSITVPTDVVQLAPLELVGNPAANQAKVRPLQGGVSISICPNRDDDCPGMGTGGALVVDSQGGHYLLSAAHVMHPIASDVIQPDSLHGGHNHTKKQVGMMGGKAVYKYSPPRDNVGGVVAIAPAGIDAAMAEIIQAVATEIGLGAPQAPAAAVVGTPVQKSGARTGITEGEVAATHLNLQNQAQKIVCRDMVKMKVPGWKANTPMNGLFLVSPGTFGDAGDSGSLIMAGASTKAGTQALKNLGVPQNAALGLLIANVPTSVGLLLVGQDITLGLNALKVTLA